VDSEVLGAEDAWFVFSSASYLGRKKVRENLENEVRKRAIQISEKIFLYITRLSHIE
jgi:hypothetical protein